MLNLVFATFYTYFFILYFGRKRSPFIIIFITIAHLTIIHLQNYFFYYGDWALGVESVYMMSICKFSSIVFNYDDGGKKVEDLKSKYLIERYFWT
jgi:hypothetical protein